MYNCRMIPVRKLSTYFRRRSRYLVRPRQTAIYLTKILTSKSLPEIGREFSNRDHTTIIHSVKSIEKLKENSLPISGKDFEVKIFVRYIAVCLGLTKYLDLLEDNISFLLILKNLHTTV